MGLGPAVCGRCELLGSYHPNLDDPTRQGDWLCPSCGLECDDSLWLYKDYKQELITRATKHYNQIKKLECPDK